MASTTQRTGARARAREKMAEHLAARREREKRLQEHLAAFFKTEDKLTSARERRDAARARADERYERDTAAVRERRAELVAAMRDVGQTVGDIADLTGLSSPDVRELHRAAGKSSERAEAQNSGAAEPADKRTNAAGAPAAEDGPTEAAAS